MNERNWHLIDAKGAVLGQIATQASILLRGKHKTAFRRYADVGDLVVIINASEVVLTGQKEEDKVYWRHSNYPGGLKSTSVKDLRQTKPEQIIVKAISGMLPKTKQRSVWLSRLRVYPGAEHPHKANIEGNHAK